MSESTYDKIKSAIEDVADEIIDVSHQIHANPELAFEEHFACKVLTESLEKNDLAATSGVYTLDTAFEANINPTNTGPTVAILAEYDALPGIGHACGAVRRGGFTTVRTG